MFFKAEFKQSFNNLFQENLLFSLSVIFFCMFLSLSIFIQSHPSDSFKPTHEMHSRVSEHIFLPGFDKNEVISYNEQLKNYKNYQQKLTQYYQEQSLKNKKKNKLPNIIPEPIAPNLLLLSLKDFYTDNYFVSNYQGKVESLDHSISCSFTYDSITNNAESNCLLIDKGHIKSRFLSKYQIVSQERLALLSKNNSDSKLPHEVLDFKHINNYSVLLKKHLILGNLYLSIIIGLFISFIILFTVAFYKSKQSNITT